MILQASQRSGAKQLAAHLLRLDENDHVQIHDIRGFMADNVRGALNEAFAVSRGTKCKQFLFSLSLNPPPNAKVSIATFEKTIQEVEKRLGLVGQPRVIVFHEKYGRRHAHCVWSRIDGNAMKAVNMSHFKLTLQSLSRELFIEHNWDMPRGFFRSMDVSPLNFTLAEWQQAKRLDKDTKRIKAAFQDCWAISDSGAALRSALEQRGYFLAAGDRRAIVALDWQGNIYSLSRWTGASASLVRNRICDLDLPSVAQVSADIARKREGKRDELALEITSIFDGARISLRGKREALIQRQRAERSALRARQAKARAQAIIERLARFRKGLSGLWDRITGRHAKIRAANLQEGAAQERLFQEQHEAIVEHQLTERRDLQVQLREMERRHERDRDRLSRDYSPEFESGQRASLEKARRQSRKPGRSPTL